MNLKNSSALAFFIPLIVVLLSLGIWNRVTFKKYLKRITAIENQSIESENYWMKSLNFYTEVYADFF